MASTYSANGAVSIQDTNYTIPAGAYFVSNTGSDSNSGSLAAPWLTVGHAISAAPAGATIVLRAGTYREGNLSSGKQLTLQPYPHEQAWLKGSTVVTGWTATGSRWMHTGWTTQFSYSGGSQIDSNYPLAGWPDMVFVNGRALTCAQAPNVANSQSSVGPGKFYIDYTNHIIYIGNNPNGATVEVAQYQTGLSITAGCVVRGLGLAHYATTYQSQYAFNVNGANCVVENNTVARCATGGINLNNVTNCAVRGNTCAFNGEQGIGGYQVNGSTASANFLAYNNTRNFNREWDAAGIKISASSNTIVANNFCDHNNCTGIWFDINCTKNNIVGNTCLYNAGNGIQYEDTCSYGIIANNLVIGSYSINGVGIQIGAGGANNVQVWNNTLSGNIYNIMIPTDNRPQGQGMTHDVTIENNIFSTVSASSPQMINVWSTDGTPASAESLGFNYNAYYRTNSSTPTMLVRFQPSSYNKLAALQTAGYEVHGIATDGGANPYFVGGSDSTLRSYYMLQPGSPAVNSGAALPTLSGYLSTNIAAAIGLSSYSGGSVNRGILTSDGPNPPPTTSTTTVVTVTASAADPTTGAAVPGTFTGTAVFTPTDPTKYSQVTTTIKWRLTTRNNQPRPEAVVLGRPPEGAVYVRLSPLGAWSWSGPGFCQAPTEVSPLMTNSRLIQCHARVLPNPDQNGKSTPDRSKLFGSHGQRPWF